MYLRHFLFRVSAAAANSYKMASTKCGEGEIAKRVFENSKRIEKELNAMEERCAAFGKFFKRI